MSGSAREGARGDRRPVRPGRMRPGAGTFALTLLLAAAAGLPAAQPTGYRTLAPGVVTVIPSDRSGDDALLRADAVPSPMP